MRIPDILSNRWVQATGVGAVAFAGGFGIGYILGQKRGARYMGEAMIKILEEDEFVAGPTIDYIDYEDLADNDFEAYEEAWREVEKASREKHPTGLGLDQLPKKAYHEITKADIEELEDEDEEDEEEENEEDLEAEGEVYLEDGPPIPQPPRKNVFTPQDDSWNYNVEQANRSTEYPYIIHQEEYMLDEQGYTQSTLTYYDGDNILADEQDVPVYQHERITGPLLFGHGSNDRNVVYIRNDELKAEYEILLFHGYFEREVLGYQAEQEAEESLAHGVMKFREE